MSGVSHYATIARMSEAVLDYPTPLAAPRAEDLLTGLHRPGGVTAAVDALADCDPGPGLCALLEALDGQLDRAQQEHLLAAWDRQVAWSMSRLYGAAAPFATDQDGAEWTDLETLRHSLGLSRHGARNIALIARRLVTVFPTTFGQLQRGRITRGHVWALVELTKDLDDTQAGQVEDLVHAAAPTQTIAEYRREVQRAVITVDPDSADRRARAQVTGRRVTKWTERGGMGRMLAELPPEDLAAAWAALNARADDGVTPDDPRGRPARLADALVESLTGVPASHDPRRDPATPPTPADPDQPFDGGPEDNGSGPDSGPEDGGPPDNGDPEPAPVTPCSPATRPPGGQVEIQVVVPARWMRWDGELTDPCGCPEPFNAPPVVLPTANRRARRAAGRTRPRGRRLTSPVHAVIGFGALFRADQIPGELPGLGPVPASVIRRMAEGPVVLRRLVVDDRGRLLDAELTTVLEPGTPLDETLEDLLLSTPYRLAPLDYGSTVYRFPAELDRHVVLRDRTCTIPGCGQPATRCDGEHAIPYPQGPTSETNCGAMCRWHHRLKTRGGWHIHRLPDESVLWTSPGGFTRRRPHYDYRRFLG